MAMVSVDDSSLQAQGNSHLKSIIQDPSALNIDIIGSD